VVREAATDVVGDCSPPAAGGAAGGRDRDLVHSTDLEGGRVLAHLAQRTRVEWLMCSPDGLPHFAAAGESPPESVPLRRGVSVRCIRLGGATALTERIDGALWLAAVGGQSRVVDGVVPHMVIVDRTTALLTEESGEGHGALETDNPTVVAALHAFFEHLWVIGTPFRLDHDATTGLDEREQSLLNLLAVGLTDEAAARKLNTSVRTTRRVAAQLSLRLGAGSRFQAGAQAVRRGWI
jgi:DNA-binding CsgD family transcriptional regulator